MAQNAIDMLKADHDKVRGLLAKLSDTTNRAEKTRKELLDQIHRELAVHTKLEEEIFYPAFKAAGGKEHNKLNYEAIEEHRAVDSLVFPDLEETDPATDQFAGRVKVLKELVEHHADEEEQDMFPLARKALSKDELRDLGEKMAARKRELQR